MYLCIPAQISVSKPVTISAEPPGSTMEQSNGSTSLKRVWDLGRADCALFVNDMDKAFTGKADLNGKRYFGCMVGDHATYWFADHCVGQIYLIFQPVLDSNNSHAPYLVYARRLDPVGSTGKADPATGLFRLKRSERGLVGSVVEASRIRTAVDVQPFFGRGSIPSQMTATNSLQLCSEFNLNKYADKDIFQLLY